MHTNSTVAISLTCINLLFYSAQLKLIQLLTYTHASSRSASSYAGSLYCCPPKLTKAVAHEFRGDPLIDWSYRLGQRGNCPPLRGVCPYSAGCHHHANRPARATLWPPAAGGDREWSPCLRWSVLAPRTHGEQGAADAATRRAATASNGPAEIAAN